MKKSMKKSSLLLVTAMMAGSLAACGSNNNEANNSANASNAPTAAPSETASEQADTAKAPDPVTLKVMLFGDKPIDMDKVLTEFENKTKDTLNTKLDIEYNPNADHKQKLTLKMSAGESVDAAFDAPWMSLNQNVSLGYYQELDKYFNNDEYPGLKKAFPEDYLNANKINGHIYSIPLTNAFYDIDVIYVRKDLREKYGMQPIQSYDDLETYLKNVQQNEKGIIPMANKNDRGFYKMFGREDKIVNAKAISMTPGFNVYLSDDGKKVLGATTLGDDASKFADLPAPYNDPYYFYPQYDKFVEWNKYIQKDVLSEKDHQALFVGGKSAAYEGTINGAAQVRQRLQSAVPGSDLEMFVYNSHVRNMEPAAIGTDYKAWNDIVIPVTSKNAERTMKFFDWLFSSSDNHDLLELGIEGEHWTKDGDRNYKMTDKTTNYVFPSYEFTWNPTMSRINGDNDEQTLKLLDYQSKNETYYLTPMSGFTFNTEPVKSEIAKISPLVQQRDPIFNNGLDKNWKQSAAKVNKQMESYGLEKVRQEVIKQVQAFLDAGGK
ncbi:ABC transporter substrate-binding protein [Paenibacillus sp. JDR-2]|uniref:ABC transporter substrate-binding protein n=1 Tax=Paenibacillus sp. (strain JDR-2) TaxID=324057 RepID=UPI000166A4A0|nr:ABC transporter substrate-binding protein [Paenibacillus sp. JDR-2]ACT00653.1 extracellular solute-binding protein family 1 [Paenibacillus sp. JDR-2]